MPPSRDPGRDGHWRPATHRCRDRRAVRHALAVFNARTETGSGFVHATRNPFLWLALGVATAFEAAALGIPALRDTLGLETMPADAWAAALIIAVAPCY
jgi:hypothetical protein